MKFGNSSVRLALATVCVLVVSGCAAPVAYDYTAFKASRPKTLLILPPINDSPDVKATYGVLSQASLPLAEAGYYTLPVSVVDETFRKNGLTVPTEIHAVSTEKLREIFGADAAVYIRVKNYGTVYAVLSSNTTVVVEGTIVDLRTKEVLWKGTASASSAESNGGGQGGLVGALVGALVNQVIASTTDVTYRYAAIANQRLLGAPSKNGILYGPRSPNYQKD